MEILSKKTTQERVTLYHEETKYSVDYDVTLGENMTYQNINGTIKEVETKQVVGYVSKSYELSVRVVNGKESLLTEVSTFATETLALLDEVIKNN